MERKLLIVRHGKSSWETVVEDIDRPLTERGIRNAYDMAERMKKLGHVPETIYSSPANRALHTATIMSRTWEIPDSEIIVRDDLYLAGPDEIIEMIFEVPDEKTTIAIFGHNPGFTQFSNRFLDVILENLPTAGIVVVSLEAPSWNDLVGAKVLNTFVDFPKKG